MTDKKLTMALKLEIVRRAGKYYGLLTADEVKKYVNEIKRDVELLKQLKPIQPTFPNFGGKQNDLR